MPNNLERLSKIVREMRILNYDNMKAHREKTYNIRVEWLRFSTSMLGSQTITLEEEAPEVEEAAGVLIDKIEAIQKALEAYEGAICVGCGKPAIVSTNTEHGKVITPRCIPCHVHYMHDYTEDCKLCNPEETFFDCRVCSDPSATTEKGLCKHCNTVYEAPPAVRPNTKPFANKKDD